MDATDSTTGLALYDTARHAIARACRVDEVLMIRDEADRMRLYARQAKDRDLMADAVEIRLRAERQLGVLLKAAKDSGQITKGRPRVHTSENGSDEEPFSRVTLEQAGIDKKLSSAAQKRASISERAFEAMVGATRERIMADRAKIIEAEPIGGARTIMASRAEPDDSLDYFPTPPFATRALMEVVLPHLGVNHLDSIWEPACGEGHIAEVLREYAQEVMATDVFDFGYGDAHDFLSGEPQWSPDWIVTNPPFNDKAEAFVLRAIEAARAGVAMFLRLQWLETVGRYERIFKPQPPALIAQFAERVPLCKGRWDPDGSTATAYLWIVWYRSHRGPTEFAWIPPGQRERLTRPDDRERFTANPVRKRDGGPIGPVWANPSIGEPEGEPESDPGLQAGSPMDDSELDIPNCIRRDANNRAPFHQQHEKPA